MTPRKTSRFSRDDGASLIEAVVVLPMLLILAIFAAEFGLAFVDWMSASNATSAGARVGTSAGQASDADMQLLLSLEEAAAEMRGTVTEVRIYEADAAGQPVGLNINAYNQVGGVWTCTNGCPWTPGMRDVTPPSLDRMGVEMTFRHSWMTNFLWLSSPVTWTDATIMRMEPETG